MIFVVSIMHCFILFPRYVQDVGELFFLQSGGNMMEFLIWKKKPLTAHYLNFLKSHQLEQLTSEDIENSKQVRLHHIFIFFKIKQCLLFILQNSPILKYVVNSPEGAEIKIPGVGVTPVAVSTQLPAAVAQLSQQGMLRINIIKIGYLQLEHIFVNDYVYISK